MNEKQNVLLLNDSFPPLIDGVANTVVNYARNLPEYGFCPTVITPDHPEAEDKVFPFEVVRYPSIDLRNRTGGYMAGLPFSPEVAGKLEGRSVDVIHAHCPVVSTLLARELRPIMDAPIVLTYHTKFDIDIANLVHSKVIQAGTRHALVKNISACDEVWAVSQGAADNLRSMGFEGSIQIMPNGVDLPRGQASDAKITEATKEYDLPPQIPLFLFVGRIMWYKGLRIILDALAMLREKNLDFRMVFIGSGQDLEAVKAYTKALNLERQVIFTGAIHDREALRAWYSRGDLFLFPSTFDTNGLVVREAAACSLGAVLIRGSAAAEGVADGENAILIEENAASMCAALEKLCSTPARMKALGEAACKELYMSWEEAVAIAARRYEEIIELYRGGHFSVNRQPVEELLRAGGEAMEDLARIQAATRHFNDTLTERVHEHRSALHNHLF